MTDENTIEIVAVDPAAPNQTTKQHIVWRCPNAACIANESIDTGDPLQLNKPGTRYFEFVSDYATCPKCSLTIPVVAKRALIHLLLRDHKGPIVGELGLRWQMACDPKRTHLATADNGEMATGDSRAANCPGCLAHVPAGKMIVAGKTLDLRQF